MIEADRLFGSRHFDSYNFLIALSDELGALGVEHHQSSEIVLPPTFLLTGKPLAVEKTLSYNLFGSQFDPRPRGVCR